VTTMIELLNLAAIPYPEIDPVIFSLGPLAIRWYALAYIVGMVLGWRWILALNRTAGEPIKTPKWDDALVWIAIGVILGGRLGYVLFYNPGFYLLNPVEALKVWQGGMSFHGGCLGVMVAMILFARRHKLPLLTFADLIAAAVPIGLFFGRIANFINGELFGRNTDVAWAFVFPGAGPSPRHPSQLYEAALEGLLLFLLLNWMVRKRDALAKPGLITGLFLLGYAAARAFVEMFRQPDAHLGFLIGGITMGQLLSLPMILGGLYLVWRAQKTPI
jgi:phosphatidylglycerol---prolipoprotein diacylglyceryl transferase